jgi:hypothetical protein
MLQYSPLSVEGFFIAKAEFQGFVVDSTYLDSALKSRGHKPEAPLSFQSLGLFRVPRMWMSDTGPSLSLCIDAAINDVGGVALKLKPSSKEEL